MNWLCNIIRSLPRGSDLAIWMLGWICIVAIYLQVDGAKEIALALGGGMVGFLTGKMAAPNTPTVTGDDK